jgi:hypothetical protein
MPVNDSKEFFPQLWMCKYVNQGCAGWCNFDWHLDLCLFPLSWSIQIWWAESHCYHRLTQWRITTRFVTLCVPLLICRFALLFKALMTVTCQRCNWGTIYCTQLFVFGRRSRLPNASRFHVILISLHFLRLAICRSRITMRHPFPFLTPRLIRVASPLFEFCAHLFWDSYCFVLPGLKELAFCQRFWIAVLFLDYIT